MNQSKLMGALVLALPLVLIFGILVFLFQVEEDEAAACDLTGGALAPAAFVDPASVPKGPIAGYSGEQLVNAATIMVVASKRGLTLRDQQIGVMAAMGESSLVNVDHGDAARNDTIGLFQIGPEHGAHKDRMNPAWAAGNFFDRLVAVEGYASLEPTMAAHRAQRNADPYHYERFWAPAGEVIAGLGKVRPANPIVPVSGAAPATSSYNLGAVKPHLTALVNVLGPMFAIKTVGGYRPSATDPNGHPAGLAADFMVPITAAGKAQGDALAAYAMANADRLQIDYIIWYQRIWSVGRAAEGWRPMEDRGSPTANHIDHVHINVVAAGGTPTSGGSGTDQVAAQACAAAQVSSGSWVAPVDAAITDSYGPRTHPVTGQASFHDGVDYGAACGTPIRAASGGIVVKAGPDLIYGNQIIIDHGNGIKTRYGHMHASGVLVDIGDQVSTGQVIANIGNAGLSTGCHLHFTVEINGETTDPIAFLANPPATGGIDAEGITVAHANIKPNPRFSEDLRAATAARPDFLSLNEMSGRSNAQLTPPGYQAFRPPAAPPSSQTRSTAIAWRTDRWHLVTGGRTLIVAAGPQRWDAGRSATWATLQNADGGRVSMVSVHHMINPRRFGPNKPQRQRLYADGMRRVQALVSTLSATGPVFVAGDFNTQYSDNDPWGPRAMLGAIGMRSTFDALGRLDTHDGGGTIDYIFFNPATASAATHTTRPLSSDHHALVARFKAPQ